MIQERLAKIQKELKAPKSQFNSFGKYYYRNCEDILEAVKPLLGDAALLISDELVMIGNRYYVKANAALCVGGEIISTYAYAREEEDKKGMDAAQITGACSSYARKYALNGLFLIDDTKDADTKDNTKKEPKTQPEISAPRTEAEYPEFPVPPPSKQATSSQVREIQIIMKKRGITEREKILEDLTGFCNRVIKSSKELSFDEAHSFIQANIGIDKMVTG